MATRKKEWKEGWKNLKKRTLIDAVFQVFSEHGLDGLTMDNVASEAGVSKGTLYAYFKNKEELVKCAIEASVTPLVDELTQVLESGSSPEIKIQQLTNRHLSYFEAHRGFFRALLYDRQAAHCRAKRHKSTLYQRLLQSTAKVVEEGMQAGVFRNANPLKIASLLIEANIAVINLRLVSENPGPVKQDANLLSDILLHGITSVSKQRKEA
jgi:TetR/AcrR family transcriptional regulator